MDLKKIKNKIKKRQKINQHHVEFIKKNILVHKLQHNIFCSLCIYTCPNYTLPFHILEFPSFQLLYKFSGSNFYFLKK